MRRGLLAGLVLFAGCASGPPPADWQLESYAAAKAFQKSYLDGASRAAESDFARLKRELSATGRLDLEARAELLRCALRATSLEFDDCPGFEKLRAYAGPEEVAYADYLAGRATRAAAEEPLSRLVSLGVQFKGANATPESISAAIEISSAQGWRRPLLAWLGVEEKRAQAAGDRDALERIRRRIALVLEKG
jgi:hypothetical protein